MYVSPEWKAYRGSNKVPGDYSHTLILMVVILYFMFSAYTTNPLLGSPGEMYSLLKQAAVSRPVEGNEQGSYLTMKSNYALVFGVIQLCSGSGTVFLDQAYWQRAIASRPDTAVKAYLLGGMAWFAIPFGFATTLGLAAVALTDNPKFPTYPNAMSSSEVSAGLASAYAATTMLGTGGAVALLIVLFMAVTSCASAELIAVSSILTFDVFKAYVKPNASPDQLILVSHCMIGVWGLVMALFASIWNIIGIDLGWLFLVMGLLIGGAVFPAAFAITWLGQTRAGAISGALVGLAAGLTAWLVEAKVYYGVINVSTTGQDYPTLAGNLAAIMTGLIVTVAVSKIFPDKGATPTWELTRAINAPTSASKQAELNRTRSRSISGRSASIIAAEEKDMADAAAWEDSPERLRGAFILACVGSFVITVCMDFIIPMPMFFSHYVFSRGFFTGWIVITFLWVFVATGISVILPLVEARGFLKTLVTEIAKEVKGKKVQNVEGVDGDVSPVGSDEVVVEKKG